MAKKRERKRSVSSSGSSSGSSGSSSSSSDSGSDSDREQRKKSMKNKKPSESKSNQRKGSDNEKEVPKRTKRNGSDDDDERRGKRDDDAPTPPPQTQTRPDTPPPTTDSVQDKSEDKTVSKFAAAEAIKKAGGRTGGIYVPPFKLAALQKEMSKMDKQSKEFQRLKWEQLRKSVNGLINKVNIANIKELIPELFEINLVRSRGLLARAIMKAQLASPGFTHIYAALVAVLNTKLPENGDLIVKRVIVGFRRAYKRRDKVVATAFAKFIAHLVNHQVLHELAALQLLTVLLDEPTDDRY